MTEKPWSLTITRAQNGFIISHFEEIEENKYREQSRVIEEDPNKEVDCESISSMLWEVMEFFSLTGSKHDKERVVINIEKK